MVFTSSASVVSRVGASSPARSALMLWRMARSSHSPSVWPSMGGSDRRVSGLGRHPADGPRSRPRPFFGNSRHRLNPFNENNVLSKSGQHRLTRKAYQIRPSPLRCNGGAGCRRKASCNPARLAKSGAECQKAAKPGAEQPGATHSLAGRAWRGLRAPPLITALGAAPPVKQTDIGPSGPST